MRNSTLHGFGHTKLIQNTFRVDSVCAANTKATATRIKQTTLAEKWKAIQKASERLREMPELKRYFGRCDATNHISLKRRITKAFTCHCSKTNDAIHLHIVHHQFHGISYSSGYIVIAVSSTSEFAETGRIWCVYFCVTARHASACDSRPVPHDWQIQCKKYRWMKMLSGNDFDERQSLLDSGANAPSPPTRT